MTLARRLQTLARLWPAPPCPACESRPPIVCVPGAETPAPHEPEGRCPTCGRLLHSVPVLIGVECDAI